MVDVYAVPGVGIEEFSPPMPIQGVATSIPVFIGVAERGRIDTPTLLTSFEQFRAVFGEPVPGTHLWYAVRAAIRNGVRSFFVVRASNGASARWEITGTSPDPLAHLIASDPGNRPNLALTIADDPLLPVVPLFRPTATTVGPNAAGQRLLTLSAPGPAARFRVGDFVRIGALPLRMQVAGVTGSTLRLSEDLPQAVAANTQVTLAPLEPTDRVLRLAPAAPLQEGRLVRGTILSVSQGAETATGVVQSVSREVLPDDQTTHRVTLRAPLGIGIDLAPAAANVPQATSREQTFTVAENGLPLAIYANASMDAAHPNYLPRLIEANPAGPVRIELVQPPPPGTLPDTLPADTGGPIAPTTNGTDEDLASLSDGDFIDALGTLTPVRDVTMVCIPDRPTAAGATMLAVQQAMITHCEALGDRFAILDSTPGLPPFAPDNEDVATQRAGLDSARGFAALYYPWVLQRDELGGPPRLTPPCGHMAGIFARAASEVGPHKSPANYALRDALGVERSMDDVTHGMLNGRAVNVLRVFHTGEQVRAWGARTTSPDTNFRYIGVRRLLIFIQQSVALGIRHAIFGVHTVGLRKRVKRAIDDFLEQQWREGALFGNKATDAFGVRIDDELNPFPQMQLGIMTIEVWLQPAFPVEFIRLRIGISESGADIVEM